MFVTWWAVLYQTKLLTHTASPPTIVDYQQEMLSVEGKQVTLTVKVAGSPTPTITWLFNGKKVEDDYSTEVGKDGSLTLVCVELKHAGTYTFSVSNSVGSVEGCTKLVVHTEDEERTSAAKVDSNPVAKEKFGEYVSGLHAHNNAAFIAQYQVIHLLRYLVKHLCTTTQYLLGHDGVICVHFLLHVTCCRCISLFVSCSPVKYTRLYCATIQNAWDFFCYSCCHHTLGRLVQLAGQAHLRCLRSYYYLLPVRINWLSQYWNILCSNFTTMVGLRTIIAEHSEP